MSDWNTDKIEALPTAEEVALWRVTAKAAGSEDILQLISAYSYLLDENKELRLAAEGMVAAFDTRPEGESLNVTEVTRESALSVAKQILGWDKALGTTI